VGAKIRLNQELLEKKVLDFLRSHYPEFKLKDAILETSTGVDEEIRSWWIACEHQDGNESIMEDEQILLMLQQEKGWKKIEKYQVQVTEREGFILEVIGE